MITLLEWNQEGHHETYLVIYAATLLRQGHRLLVLCQDLESFESSISNRIDPSERLRMDVAAIPGPKWFKQRRHWPQILAYAYFSRCILREIRHGEKRAGEKASELFFCCLYEHQTRMIHAVTRRIGGRRWSGLYLQAHAFHNPNVLGPGVKRKWPVSRLWKQPGLRGLLMLDEIIAPHVSEIIGHPVFVLPDIASTELRREVALVSELEAFALGRTIIGLIGHIIPSKGVATFLRCAQHDDMQNIVFAVVGTVQWNMFSSEDQMLLKEAFSLPNVWLRDLRIPDEASYNALFAMCDVIYAAYENFPHSSNTLTKAAAFQKPVLVHDGTLMAERVRCHRIGECLPQDCQISKRCQALLRLAGINGAAEDQPEPDWRGYLATHSEQRLAEVFAGFFRNA